MTPPEKPSGGVLPRTPEERALLDWVERVRREKLSPQQASLALKQAQALGELYHSHDLWRTPMTVRIDDIKVHPTSWWRRIRRSYWFGVGIYLIFGPLIALSRHGWTGWAEAIDLQRAIWIVMMFAGIAAIHYALRIPLALKGRRSIGNFLRNIGGFLLGLFTPIIVFATCWISIYWISRILVK